MAKLYFYYASMNAGKSAHLLQADFNYRERGMRTMLWTAALDSRSGGRVKSRIGLESGAHLFTPETDLWAAVMAEHAAAWPGRIDVILWAGADRIAFPAAVRRADLPWGLILLPPGAPLPAAE